MLVLVTGLYRRVLQGFFVSKLHDEKQEREEEENKKKMTVDELKMVTEQQQKEIERLEDELRAARIIAETDDDSGATIVVWHCGIGYIEFYVYFMFYSRVCMFAYLNDTLVDE